MKAYMFKSISENNKLCNYIFKPVNSQILTYDSHELFDIDNKHLEYFPIINQRAFSVGQ